MEFRLQWKPAVCEENVLIFIMVLWTCQVVIRYFLNNFHRVILQDWGIMKTVILWTVSRTTSNTCFWIRNKLKPEPCSLYHRIESTVDQQHLVSVKHSGLSLRQREVNALRQSCTILHPQSLPFLLGWAWITAGELKAGTCFYLSDTPALWDDAGRGWKR